MINELYQKFPIEVSITRKKCRSLGELKEYAMIESGDCFASVYHNTGDRVLIDKIFFDLDNDFIPYVYIELLKLKDKLKEYGTTVHVYTGKKGFHCYLLLKSGYYGKEQAKEMLGGIFAYFFQDIKYLDPRVTSDVNRLSRIPNTTREGGICSLLPQELPPLWLTLSKTLGRFNYYEYVVERKMTLSKLYSLVKGSSYKYKGEIPKVEINIEITGEGEDAIRMILSRILRPCVFKGIAHSEAGHEARTAAAIELMRAGLEPATATDMLESFRWSDFDFRLTFYHLSKVRKEGLKPYSCKKMKNFCVGIEKCWYMKLLKGEWE